MLRHRSTRFAASFARRALSTEPALSAASTARSDALDSLAEGMARPMTDMELESGSGSYLTGAEGERRTLDVMSKSWTHAARSWQATKTPEAQKAPRAGRQDGRRG